MEQFITPTSHKKLNITELYSYREVFIYFITRDLLLRYKHVFIALFWIIFPPFLMSYIFNFSFGKLMPISSIYIPYLVFAFSGLIFWNCFSSILTKTSNSISTNRSLLKQVYLPRLLIPLSSGIISIVDFIWVFLFFILLLFYYHIPFSILGLYFIPLYIFILFLTAMGIGIFFATFTVLYKDVSEILPLTISLLFFLTPVIYPIRIVSEKFHMFLYLNPMVGVIETFRTGLFAPQEINWAGLGVSFLMSIFFFFTGVFYLKKNENQLIDTL